MAVLDRLIIKTWIAMLV